MLSQTQNIALISLVAFTLLMVTVGLYGSKKTKDIGDFVLGGRSVGPWITAFAYGTSYFSAVVFIGYAGMHGWNIGIGSLWIGIGNALIGCLSAWILLAKKTRSMTHRLSASTMPEFFEKRFDSKPLKIYSAVIIFIFLVPYAAGVYKGLGTLFGTIFPGAGENVCMLIVAVLTAFYLVLGGYIATSLNDFIQGIIMFFGIIAMLITVFDYEQIGGFSGWFNKLSQISADNGLTLTSIFGGNSFRFLCVNILLTSIGCFGLPQMVHKFYAIKSEGNIKQATIISTIFSLFIGCGAYLVGTMGRILIPSTPEGTPVVGYDNVVPTILTTIFSEGIWSSIILSVVLLLLLSASMSTLASVVLTSGSAISIDLLLSIKPKMEQKNQLLLMRVICFSFVALSYIFATMNISFIVNLMSFSWGVVAGSFVGPYVWGLYNKKITKAAAWAGSLSGLVIVVVGIIVITVLSDFNTAKSFAPELGVGAIICSLISVPVVSLFTKKYEDAHIEKVFEKK